MTIRTRWGDLHVDVRGPRDAPAVLFLHGFPVSGAMWEPQLGALADRWRVIAPDLRGLGRSEPGEGPATIEFMADDVFDLLDALGTGPVVGCGLSMGGYVLLRAVEREPARFRGLVLADTRSQADGDEARLKRLDGARAILQGDRETWAASFLEAALGRTTRAEHPAVVEAMRALIDAAPARGMAAALVAMAARTDTTAALAAVRVPTLVVVGEEDTITPPEASARLAEAVPGARLAVLPRAGHMSSLEAPHAFTDELLAFLEGLPAG